MRDTKYPESLPAGPSRPGGRLSASAKLALGGLLWLVVSFAVAFWVQTREERAAPPEGAASLSAHAERLAGTHDDRARALALQAMDAMVARVLPRALPQADWQREPAPGKNAVAREPAENSDVVAEKQLRAGSVEHSVPGDAIPSDADLGVAAPGHVRRFTVRGPCAPLRLGLALLEALREDAARPGGQAFGSDATVRWTAEGALEVLLYGRVSHVFMFPGRAGELADLAQPLPQAALALVLDDMGQKLEVAGDVASLPFPVAMAIWPRSPHARETAETAAARRLDCLLHQPMEALPRADRHRPDPGPGALFTHMNAAELRETLAANLRSLPTVIGLNNHMGSAFTGNLALCRTLCGFLRGSGLAVLDSVTRPNPQLAAAAREAGLFALERDVFLDTRRDVADVLKALDAAAARARAHGVAVAIGHPYPETLRALRDWQDREGTAVVPLRRIIWKLAQDAAAAAQSHSPNSTMDKE